MYTPQTNPQSTNSPDGWQVVELQPVIVFTSRLGQTIAAFRRSGIYFQFGPRRPNESVLFVLPDDHQAAISLSVQVGGPLTGMGCNVRLMMAVGVVVALILGAVALLAAGGLGA